MSTFETLTFETIATNVNYLLDVAPNLRINNPLFGVLKLNEVLSISRD
jgi:hypothetical protein